MAKFVYLRDLGVYPDETIIDRAPTGFFRLFKMHLCWVTEMYGSHLFKKVKIPFGKVNVTFSDQAVDPPEHVAEQMIYTWHINLDAYYTADDEIKKRTLLDKVHAALVWQAEKEAWPIEPFKKAYRCCIDSNLTCETLLDPSWVSPDKKNRVRIHALHDLETIKFSAVLFRNRSSKEIGRRPLGSVQPSGHRMSSYVENGKWISPTVFVLHPSGTKGWTADFSQM